MEELQIPSGIKRVLSMSFIFILISSFIVILIGNSLQRTNREIKELRAFIIAAEDIQPNFEKSLQMYTESTKTIIDYLLSLRPSNENEEEYIEFISGIEDIGQRHSLNLDLRSIGDLPGTNADVEAGTLRYSIGFYGNMGDLEDFLEELESLPYFIRTDEINFTNPEFITEKETTAQGNIDLKIKLYTK